MKRREVLQTLGTFLASRPLAAQAGEPHRKILLFSRSVLFEHSVIARAGGQLSFAEKVFVELAKQIGCDVECSKDGRVFDQDIERYAAIVSYTCGRPADLMKSESKDHSAPISERGYRNLDRAVRAGKPLVGIHPGIWFLPGAMGADCLGHGAQHVGKMVISSPKFPGLQGLGESFSFLEEWFSLAAFTKDLHVILVQDCAGMDKSSPVDKRLYDRPPFPATWARMHDKGRVFYTSMGHREDVWTNKIFQQILLGGLRWALRDVAGDIKPNLAEVAPHANDVGR
jgi:type 1 glutamine amidotransferase